jgi:hypothetical protein
MTLVWSAFPSLLTWILSTIRSILCPRFAGNTEYYGVTNWLQFFGSCMFLNHPTLLRWIQIGILHDCSGGSRRQFKWGLCCVKIHLVLAHIEWQN